MVQVPTKILRVKVFAADGSSFEINPFAENTQIEMSFAVSMSVTPQPNFGSLQVRNLGEELRNKLSTATDATLQYVLPGVLNSPVNLVNFPHGRAQEATNQMGKAYIVVSAGEDNFVGKTFEGSCEFPMSTWADAEWNTDIPIADGQTPASGSVIVISHPRNVTLFQVISDVIKSMGIDPGNFTQAQLNASVGANVITRFPKGFHITAGGGWFLSEVMRLTGAEWWVDRGKLYVVKKGQPIDGPFLEITDQTWGVRTPPQQLDRDAVRLDMDYRRLLRLGTGVRVSTKRVSGRYRCDEVVHMLDNGPGDWKTESILRLIPSGT